MVKNENRVVLASLLHDENTEAIAKRLGIKPEIVTKAVLNNTELIMNATAPNMIPLVLEKEIKESIQSP